MNPLSSRKILSSKAGFTATLLALFDHVRVDRGLTLAPFTTRCVRAGDIHEFLVVGATRNNKPIDHVGYLGFAEFGSGGVIEVDDDVVLSSGQSFRVLGFDETHAPNHINIILAGLDVTTGVRCGLSVGDTIWIRPTPGETWP